MAQQINLVDPTLLPAANQQFTGVAVAILGVAAVIGVTVHYVYEKMQLANLLAQMAAMETAGTNPSDEAVRIAQAEAELELRTQELARKEALRDALAAWSDLPAGSTAKLGGIIAALPDSLWLQNVEFTGREGLRITGGAIDPAALAAYAQRLGRIEGFSGVPLQVVALEQPKTRDTATAAPGADAAGSPLPIASGTPPRDEGPAHYRFVMSSMTTTPGEAQ